MKKAIQTFIMVITIQLLGAQPTSNAQTTSSASSVAGVNSSSSGQVSKVSGTVVSRPLSAAANTAVSFHVKAAVKEILLKYTLNGLPGAVVSVYSPEHGSWSDAAGYSNVAQGVKMTTSMLQYLQSVTKTYLAVAILKLYEDGQISLDAPVTRYLSAEQSRDIQDLDKVSIRMLLNHTSGLPEYSDNPAFVSFVMLHPTTVFNIEDGLSYISREKFMFQPGSKHRYCNTNYLLLSMIADKITGDHAAYIDKVIFKELGLKNTFYRSSAGYLKYKNLVHSYWDVLNTGRPADITPLQIANVATLKGDDGIVCTPDDAVTFLKGLTEGKLLKDATFREMQAWVNDDAGKPIYGLGLVYYEAGGLKGYGHSGGGIGAGCVLIYVPEKQTYIFMATNTGTLFGGQLAEKANAMKDEILTAILF
jgi:D-alanyl-D-alanine carboxypeptidase